MFAVRSAFLPACGRTSGRALQKKLLNPSSTPSALLASHFTTTTTKASSTLIYNCRSNMSKPTTNNHQLAMIRDSSLNKFQTRSTSSHLTRHNRPINPLLSKKHNQVNFSVNGTRLFLFQSKSPFPYTFLISPQLGSVSHFSSFFGGSGRRPVGGGGGNRLAQGAGMLGAAGIMLGKGKYLLGALKLTKLASLGSMVLTIGTYSVFFGLPYACGIVGLILVHEIGHVLVMLQRGIPFSPMVFMPFVGAVIAMNKMPRDAWEDALVAFGGPVLGSVGAGVVAVAAHSTDSQLLYALADFGFMVNLFNLLPIGSMDGGRITGALSPYAGVVGLGLGGALVYSGNIHNPIFYLILLAGGYDTFQRFYNPHGHTPPHYYKITGPQRAILTGGYFGLVAALLVAMDANSRYRKPPEVLMREREMEMSWDMR